jgi:hypothetical protein
MKAKDHLYLLIHSLTRMEKRYFKIDSNRQAAGEGKNYIVLFDLLDAMPVYDQELLKAGLEKEGIGGNISALKAYLHKLILRSMRAFNSERSTANRLRETLMDAEFLIQKGLYQQATAALDRTRLDARGLGRSLTEIEVLGMEAHAILLQENLRLPEQMDRVLAARDEAIRRFTLEADLQRIFLQLLARHRKHGNLRGEPQKSEVLALVAQVPADLVPDQLSAHAQTFYYYILVLKEECLGDPQSILTASRRHLQAWEADPMLAKEYPTNYRRALANHLAALFKADQFDAFPDVLQRLKALPPLHHDDEAEIFQNAAFYEFLYHLNRAALEEAAALVPAIERGLATYADRLNKSREISFCFNICLMYFFRESWSLALRWLNRLVNDRPSEQRLDIQQVLRIFELILHYELENQDLMESKLRAAARHYKLYHAEEPLFAGLIDFFGKLLKAGRLEALRPETRALHARVSAIPQQTRPPGILEFSLWLEARLNGDKLPDVLRKFIQSGEKSA